MRALVVKNRRGETRWYCEGTGADSQGKLEPPAVRPACYDTITGEVQLLARWNETKEHAIYVGLYHPMLHYPKERSAPVIASGPMAEMWDLMIAYGRLL
jgi:hypothetical protein